MAKVMLATGMIVAYGYLMESFMAWYSRNPFEEYVMLRHRPFGPYAHTYWMMLTCNVFIPQLLWFPAVRRNALAALGDRDHRERRHVAGALRDRGHQPEPGLPAVVLGRCTRDGWDYATFYGTLGLFLSLLFLFIRFLPVISIAEMRELVHETQEQPGTARSAAVESTGRTAMTARRRRATDVYGLMAEFDIPRS